MTLHAAHDAAPRPLVLTDPREAEEASSLIADFGDAAPAEASRRAVRSRDLGNVIHFCRWRRIGRLVALLSGQGAHRTRH